MPCAHEIVQTALWTELMIFAEWFSFNGKMMVENTLAFNFAWCTTSQIAIGRATRMSVV